MNVFKETKGHGEAVVLIHGWCYNHKHMQPIVEQLSSNYQVINIDLPGSGKSSWSPQIKSIDDIATQILPALPQKAIYIGWSFGGLVAIAIAAKYPDRVKHLIGICTTPKLIADKDWVAFPHPRLPLALDAIHKNGLKAALKQNYATEFSRIHPQPDQWVLANHLIDESPDIPEEIIFKGVEISDTADLREEFATIQCPIDFVMGEDDPKVLLTSTSNIKALNPRVKFHCIHKAMHSPFWTHPQEFNTVLHSILK